MASVFSVGCNEWASVFSVGCDERVSAFSVGCDEGVTSGGLAMLPCVMTDSFFLGSLSENDACLLRGTVQQEEFPESDPCLPREVVQQEEVPENGS